LWRIAERNSQTQLRDIGSNLLRQANNKLIAPIAGRRDAEILPELNEFLAKAGTSLLLGTMPQQRGKPRARPAFTILDGKTRKQRSGAPAANRQGVSFGIARLECAEQIDRYRARHGVFYHIQSLCHTIRARNG